LKHLSSDELELYALNRLGPDSDRIIEEHLLTCAVCLNSLQNEDGVIQAVRISFSDFDVMHETDDGDVRLWAEPAKFGWAARIEGPNLWSLRTANTAEGARSSIVTAFREMFPEHQCTERCGTRELGKTG
jgi:hypothetical protein